MSASPARVRREPPAFLPVTVRNVTWVSPRLVRVSLAGPDLDGLAVELPAASVRLLLPSPGARELVLPRWNGNEFLLPDGRRPTIRTFTPLGSSLSSSAGLDLEIVIHGGGEASRWAESAAPGDKAAVSGPGRGYRIDDSAPAFFLAGDETAIPAIGQLLAALPGATLVRAVIEVADARARIELPDHPHATVDWCKPAPGALPGDALLVAVRDADLVPGTQVWVAGEAAGVQRIRRHLYEERGLARAQATVRGYWKHGRAGGADDA